MRKLLVLIFSLSVFSLAQIQTPVTAPAATLDADAVPVLNNALNALGGSSVYASRTGAIAVMSQVEPFKSSHSIHFKDSWAEGQSEFRREYPGRSASLVSNHGHPRASEPRGTTPIARHVAHSIAAFHVPGAVLYGALHDGRHSAKLAATEKIGTISAVHIRIWDATDFISTVQSTQDWYFDPTTFLPIQVVHRAADPRDGVKFTKYTLQYEGWQQMSGVAVPQQLIEKAPNGSRTVKSVDSVELVPSIAATEFEVGGAQ
jgi:hypothetical protein